MLFNAMSAMAREDGRNVVSNGKISAQVSNCIKLKNLLQHHRVDVDHVSEDS